MATFYKATYIPKDLAEKIGRYLAFEPKTEKDCLGEDDTITETIDFGNGMQMDVKCCGVQYTEGESNKAWTEAVLFSNGCEVGHSDVCDEFLGEWEITDSKTGDTYIGYVYIGNV